MDCTLFFSTLRVLSEFFMALILKHESFLLLSLLRPAVSDGKSIFPSTAFLLFCFSPGNKE